MAELDRDKIKAQPLPPKDQLVAESIRIAVTNSAEKKAEENKKGNENGKSGN